MKRRLLLLTAAVGTALLVALLVVGVASAWPGRGDGSAGNGKGEGYGGGAGPGYATAQKAIADTLGITADQLQEQRQAGKTVQELVQEKGVALDQIRRAVREAREASVRQAAAEDTITQDRAQIMLEHVEQNQARLGECDGTGAGNGPGPRAGECTQTQAQTTTQQTDQTQTQAQTAAAAGSQHRHGQ